MKAFEYVSPTTIEQAISLLSATRGETEILAGGTDLLSLLKDDVVAPKRLVNIKEIKELHGIRADESGLRIGALVAIEELLQNADIRKEYAAVQEAAEGIASPQIQNMGTVGGELLQRPRCWYFRGGFGLLAKQNGKSLVPEGDNRYHAILGNAGPAYFVHASRLAPALIALNARVKIAGPKGEREIPVTELFVIPKSDSERENTLMPNEILTEILIPKATGVRSATYEVRQKESLDWPLVAATVALKMNGGTVQSAHVVLGHVAPIPWDSAEAAQALAGKSVSEATAAAAGEAAVQHAKPLSHNKYKVQLARVAVKRAILQAAKGGNV